MIVGVGVDSIEIFRVEKAIEKEHFLKSVFTEAEQQEIDVQRRRAASDFAGKEAVVKVLGTGFGIIRAAEIEILRKESGEPYVILYGNAKKIAEEKGICQIHISITNTKQVATAFAIGEAGDKNEIYLYKRTGERN